MGSCWLLLFSLPQVKTKKRTTTSRCGNAALAENLLLWTFRQRGVLRARNVHFAKAGEERAPEDGFRIKDDLVWFSPSS